MAVFLIALVIFTIVVIFVLYKASIRRGQTVPPISELHKDKITVPASVLARKICNGEIKAEDVMVAYIERIKSVNNIINAIVKDRFELALEEARELDRALDCMTEEEKEVLVQDKVLLGVPFTNKECFAAKGMPQCSGLVSRRNFVSSENADVVQRMEDAGAILVAVSNVSELCMWWETSNCVYGKTRNPYDSERIVGGSSGGEAAIIAAAGSLIGTGSDIGGSIRMPAFFNGVFGHKASPGVVSNSGQFPNAAPHGQDFLITGPICRYATDLRTVLKVMSGDSQVSTKLEIKVDLSQLRFYSISSNNATMVSKVSPELQNIQEKVCEYLERDYNVSVEKLELQRLKNSLAIWSTMMSRTGGPTFCQLMGGTSGAVNPFWELIKWCLGVSSHTFPAISLGLAENIMKVLPQTCEEAVLKSGEKLRQEIEDLLGDDGVLLYPSHPTTALRHNMPILKPFNFAYTAIFNVLYLPVTQCPLGLGSDGLPLGIQIVASRNNDHLTLAIAEALEKAFGGWVPPQ